MMHYEQARWQTLKGSLPAGFVLALSTLGCGDGEHATRDGSPGGGDLTGDPPGEIIADGECLDEPCELCGAERFCSHHQTDYHLALYAVHANAEDDAWAVGQAGTILHWNGQQWFAIPSGVGEDLRAVWGSGADDIWIGGDAALLLHWDGDSLRRIPLESPSRIAHIHGRAADNVWLAGGSAIALHWNGDEFTEHVLDAERPAAGLWTSPEGQPWVLTETELFRLREAGWEAFEEMDELLDGSRERFAGIFGDAQQNIRVVKRITESNHHREDLHFDGETWTSHRVSGFPLSVTALWGLDEGLFWRAEDSGGIFEFDEGEWTRIGGDTYQGGYEDEVGIVDVEFWGIGGSGRDDLWLVGEGGSIARFDGDQVSPIHGMRGGLGDLWVSPAGELYAVGNGLYIWDGQQGSYSEYPSGRAIDGFEDEVWVVPNTRGSVRQYKEGSWSDHDVGPDRRMTSLHVAGRNDVWVAGGSGVVVRWDGEDWEIVRGVSFQGPVSYAVWSDGDGRAWTTGDRSDYFDGETWHRVGGSGRALWSDGDSTLFRGGEAGLFRWDDEETSWESPNPDASTTPYIRDLAGLDADRLWALTDDHGILFYEDGGQTRTTMELPEGANPSGLWVTETHLWVVGANGMILSREID